MLITKCLVPSLVLCLAHGASSTPTTDYITQGRGIGSTLWGWITYPFTYWISEDPEQPSMDDILIRSTTYGPYDNIEIGKHNITVWCNDQTCTTMKCDKYGCRNVTCNIYDTDMSGECREYNTMVKPEESLPGKPTETATKPIHNTLSVTTVAANVTTASDSVASTEKENNDNQPTDERPLELEAVLSSTVTEANADKDTSKDKLNNSSSPQNKI